MKDLVSVIIPSYRRPNGLKTAINSVLKQTYPNIEVIVVDDNNPNTRDREETENIMKRFNNMRNIKYIKHDRNKNGSVARNTGIKHASGNYIAFLDNDDEFLKDKIKLQIDKLNELGDSYGIAYTKFIRKINGRVIDRGIENRTGFLTKEILMGSFYINAGSNILIRRSIVEKINGFDERLKRRQDLDFLARASLITKIAHVPECCLVIHKDDRSNATALTFEESKEANTLYLNNCKDFIQSLPKKEQQKISTYHIIQYIRINLLSGNIKKAVSLKRKYKISYSVLINYFFYLLKRKIFKQCYGFRI